MVGQDQSCSGTGDFLARKLDSEDGLEAGFLDNRVYADDTASSDLNSDNTANRILDLILTSLRFLSTQCMIRELISRVPGKEYFSYAVRSTIQPAISTMV